jgi:glycosyltransferase involved in cell wall biosynthesis
MDKNFPKVSVIIPMYNAEKYLAICLESILIQTLTDYEVILVDDCSTDNSCAVAESYLEKFGGRLKIITLEENTGSGAVPRNVGLEFSRGKYIFFMDSDDLIIDTALETLYDLAEDSQAEVLYMGMYFWCDEEPVPKNIGEHYCPNNYFAGKTNLEPEDIPARIEKLLSTYFWWPPWAKFFRRDFLINNNIKFPKVTISEDILQTFKVICLAKKILQISPTLYVHRVNRNSILHSKRSPEKELIFWTNPLINGMKYLDEFMSEMEFFKENPVRRLQVLHFFANIHFDHIKDAIKILPEDEIYKILLREFSDAGCSHSELISYLLFIVNIYRNELNK